MKLTSHNQEQLSRMIGQFGVEAVLRGVTDACRFHALASRHCVNPDETRATWERNAQAVEAFADQYLSRINL